jgi:hypothetical protein
MNRTLLLLARSCSKLRLVHHTSVEGSGACLLLSNFNTARAVLVEAFRYELHQVIHVEAGKHPQAVPSATLDDGDAAAGLVHAMHVQLAEKLVEFLV